VEMGLMDYTQGYLMIKHFPSSLEDLGGLGLDDSRRKEINGGGRSPGA